MVEIEKSSSPTAVSPASGESNEEKANQHSEIIPPIKRKRNLPGMPDPDAEVIALSPKTLLAKNRFVCEICNKGFQRDQNLQLHRRGHNLPWKLRQRSVKEVRKRVYVCPEPTCIHHGPSRALGDLTGIKKHFCRKHGEKKYKCERCSKKYAVQSDCKAHMKTCGTREYRCDCGTLFSRRDSFITHRAFCDALGQETARSSQPPADQVAGSPPPPPPLTPSAGVLSPVLSIQSSAELPENHTAHLPQPSAAGALSTSAATTTPAAATTTTAATTAISSSSTTSSDHCRVFTSIFNASTSAEPSHSPPQMAPYSSPLCSMAGLDQPTLDPMSLSLSSSFYGASSLFPTTSHYTSSAQPAISATALLQKAAQMGATSSNSSFLRGLGLALPSSSDPQDNASIMVSTTSSTPLHWNNNVKLENNSMASGLGLGLPSGGSSGYNELMMSQSTLFGDKPATFDFLGLGMGSGEASSGGFSVFLNSIDGALDMGSTTFGSGGDTWDDPSDRKPSML
ncbi:hypothetical protein RD792_012363 [Penstemon davidsonii]|uniref:C2H2-type domain-containing protein n=1 Tax=Penstemon davidsonii TaxID=160366 RepID=A0ABR0CWM2_9LAMI|nr:hypothetical protein RD792_012363 [Penstemon davidsonii]